MNPKSVAIGGMRVRCFFVPPHVSERLAEGDPDALRPQVAMDAGIRQVRSALPLVPSPGRIRVLDARRTWRSGGVWADPELRETQLLHRHAAVCGQALGVEHVPDGVVRYGLKYNNAFYDGHKLVFGEGDGSVFGDFTESLDVFAHELGHRLVDAGPGLVYQGLSGALNEHLADVFGICAMQFAQGLCEDWRIGDELFLDGRSALRDMKDPGSAYDNELLGRDPQPGHVDHLYTGAEDNGGVHINSGVPNRVFYLFQRKTGLPSWGEPLAVWRAAMMRLGPRSEFGEFAAQTVDCAGGLALAVRESWAQVGISV